MGDSNVKFIYHGEYLPMSHVYYARLCVVKDNKPVQLISVTQQNVGIIVIRRGSSLKWKTLVAVDKFVLYRYLLMVSGEVKA